MNVLIARISVGLIIIRYLLKDMYELIIEKFLIDSFGIEPLIGIEQLIYQCLHKIVRNNDIIIIFY